MHELKKCVVQESGPCTLSGPHPRADLVGRDTGESRIADPLPSHAPTAIRRVGPAPRLGRTVELALVV